MKKLLDGQQLFSLGEDSCAVRAMSARKAGIGLRCKLHARVQCRSSQLDRELGAASRCFGQQGEGNSKSKYTLAPNGMDLILE